MSPTEFDSSAPVRAALDVCERLRDAGLTDEATAVTHLAIGYATALDALTATMKCNSLLKESVRIRDAQIAALCALAGQSLPPPSQPTTV